MQYFKNCHSLLKTCFITISNFPLLPFDCNCNCNCTLRFWWDHGPVFWVDTFFSHTELIRSQLVTINTHTNLFDSYVLSKSIQRLKQCRAKCRLLYDSFNMSIQLIVAIIKETPSLGIFILNVNLEFYFGRLEFWNKNDEVS